MTGEERSTPIVAPDVLVRLRERYRVTACATIDGLRALAVELAPLSASSPASSDLLLTLRERLHQLRGSAGSYGLAEASRLAGALEERVARWIGDPTLEANERVAAILGVANALEAAVMER